MNCVCKRKVQKRVNTILELQEALLSERMEAELFERGNLMKLRELQIRLERVRSWGGSYSTINYSQDIRDVLGEINSPLRPREVAS